mmetsp:Transcript_3177/g.7200  ORF Transcript_3177/g.7200 Transcript_3177/m.7200 type:complete len:253 (+) Transcript_3177:84-842(+)
MFSLSVTLTHTKDDTYAHLSIYACLTSLPSIKHTAQAGMITTHVHYTLYTDSSSNSTRTDRPPVSQSVGNHSSAQHLTHQRRSTPREHALGWFVEYVEPASTQLHGFAHDDALADARHGVLPVVEGRLKQMLVGLLERRQHQRRTSHLGNAEATDAQHFTPVGHDVAEEVHVPDVDLQPVRTHRRTDLLDDRVARSLDAQHRLHLHDVVGPDLGAVDALEVHDLLQTVSLHSQTVLQLRLIGRAAARLLAGG